MRVETERGGFTVHCTASGRPPVVLLHALALAGDLWDPLARYLGAGHDLFAPDARGHGASDWDGGPFTVADLAEDVASIVEALDVGPVDVVGLSMGGSTALELAASHPEFVRRLVLADTTACYGPQRVEQWAERARRAEEVPREKQVDFQHDRWFTPSFRERKPAEVARVSRIFTATDSRAHAAACHALGGLDATDRLGDIKARTLVLVGDEDYATPPEMAERIAENIPDARLEVLSGTRHLSLVERCDIWPTIAEHLARPAVRGAP
jgi:3-oxoadipate enol-lactonase